MSLLRSAFAGLGTASGVAWPFLGLSVAIFGLAAGSGAAVSLGVLSGGLFALVSIPVLYWTYQHFQKKENKLSDKFKRYSEEYLNQFYLLINQAQLAYQKQCEANSGFNQNFYQFLRNWLNEMELNSSQDFSLNLQFLACLKQNKQQWLHVLTLQGDARKSALRKPLYEFLLLSFHSEHAKGATADQKREIAFIVFAGAFGSVAGFSSGFSSLLSSMGLFAGLGSFPVLCLGILVLAIGLALFAASQAVELSDQHSKKKWLYKSLKASRQHLETLQNEPVFSAEQFKSEISTKDTDHYPPLIHNTASKPGSSATCCESLGFNSGQGLG
ncbi:hypothetical protein [Legionella genomosp. 1]|uniref:hypothetical protein n=1 Tax=Legionella genomosp. 1 TaxID=1093625 RepID=UPI001056CFD5|nr:hypothetical protein [Legionella genomosp. 1]